jgi:hypothetical protein
MSMDQERLRAQAEFSSHVRELQDFDIDEIRAAFALDDVVELDRYQVAVAEPAELIALPISPAFHKKYGNAALLLAHNTTVYDDSVEDAIFEDKVIGSLVEYRSRLGDSAEQGDARRARRSVVAYWLAGKEPAA